MIFIYFIYKIENKINHKKYIGLTNNILRRKNRHFSDLRNNRHDNKFLQFEFNKYGEDNFDFEKIFEGEISDHETGEKEREYISFYDSYQNGYNQNEGGNFGASNGGTKLLKKDIFNILSALEFCSRPGGVLSKMYNVSLTTVSRIKKGENHNQYKEEYDKLSLEERKAIYEEFCVENNFITLKNKSSRLITKRKLTKEQVFLIMANFEFKVRPIKTLTKELNLSSDYTLYCIKKGNSYQDYVSEYNELSEESKKQLVSLLSNQ